MALNFPASPSLDQIHHQDGASYEWTGSKWRRIDTFENAIVVEYSDIVEQTSNTALIEPDKYSYFKITVDDNTTITVPSASQYSSFVLQLEKNVSGSPYDLVNAVYDNVSFSVATQDGVGVSLVLNNDGTKMYILGGQTVRLYQYTLSTAFDLSTASYSSVLFNFAAQDGAARSLAFNNDGTKMYISGVATRSIYQYSLSTAFDISTASYDSVSFNVSAQTGENRDIAFNNDGTKMYIVDPTSDAVYQYSLSTAFNLSTASYDSVSFSVVAQDNSPTSSFFSNNGAKMYVLGNTSDTVYQYTTSSATVNTITWSDNIQWAGGTAPSIDYNYSTDVLINFTTYDGNNWIGTQLSLDSRSS